MQKIESAIDKAVGLLQEAAKKEGKPYIITKDGGEEKYGTIILNQKIIVGFENVWIVDKKPLAQITVYADAASIYGDNGALSMIDFILSAMIPSDFNLDYANEYEQWAEEGEPKTRIIRTAFSTPL